MLKPLETLTRTLLCLDGLWNFGIAESPDLNALHNWTDPIPPTIQVPVPASYNDVLNNQTMRDHIGWVYYQREARVPRIWSGECYFIRFDSATHEGKVFVNDELVTQHVGGYTLFEVELTQIVGPGEPFRLTIAVNNELTIQTIPPGRTTYTPSGKRRNVYHHDFFNYAGLARSVWLYSVPQNFIEDITVVTNIEGENTGVVHFDIQASDNALVTRVLLKDEEGQTVHQEESLQGSFTVQSAHLWRPGAAYLYQLQAELLSEDGSILDTYELPVGIRSVQIQGNQFLINNKPFYFTGFGKHEDGPDILDYADRHGFVIIDETAAVGLSLSFSLGNSDGDAPDTWSDEGLNNNTQAALLQSVRELIARDKNRPSVVMWSLINEPASNEEGAREFFEPVVSLTRELDPSRPLCYSAVQLATPTKDLIVDLFDIVALNRYYGWYDLTGDLEEAELSLRKELLKWQDMYGKPILMTEYGADTQAGLHTVLDVPWSEEFQSRFLEMYHRVFDEVEGMVGEHVWNFADFQTSSGVIRVDGNKKGVFTRERRPKSAAHTLQKRWKGRDKMGWVDGQTKGGS